MKRLYADIRGFITDLRGLQTLSQLKVKSMRFPFFKNQKATVMGIGLSGRVPGIVSFFAKRGAQITATDLRSAQTLRQTIKQFPFGVRVATGKHHPKDFSQADWIIKNPAIPRDSEFLAIANRNGVPILTDIGIFFLGLPPEIKVVGITGTKGKTTTTHMIAALLSRRLQVRLVGVPGTSYLSLLDNLAKIKPRGKNRATKIKTVVVAELSSFDLEGLSQVKKSPDIAVITNISPDHLNRYKSMQDYVNAKSLNFAFQNTSGVIVANKNDLLVKKMVESAPGKVKWFRTKKGDHMATNANAARAVAKIFKIPAKEINQTLSSFQSLPGHLERVARKQNIDVVNDTAATNPLAAKTALTALLKENPNAKIVMILGGADKKLNFSELLPELSKISAAVLLPGDASLKIKKALAKAKISQVVEIRTLIEALQKANILCHNATKAQGHIPQKRGVILFAPAAASFNMFKNEFDRGAQFNQAVKMYFK